MSLHCCLYFVYQRIYFLLQLNFLFFQLNNVGVFLADHRLSIHSCSSVSIYSAVMPALLRRKSSRIHSSSTFGTLSMYNIGNCPIPPKAGSLLFDVILNHCFFYTNPFWHIAFVLMCYKKGVNNVLSGEVQRTPTIFMISVGWGIGWGIRIVETDRIQ